MLLPLCVMEREFYVLEVVFAMCKSYPCKMKKELYVLDVVFAICRSSL